MNTAVGIGIGIAYGTRVTGNYNPGFSLTAPVLAFASATDPDSDNTQDLEADFFEDIETKVVRLVGTFGSSTVSEPYDVDASNTIDGTEAGNLEAAFTTGAIDDGVCSFKCRIEDGSGNALSDWSNTVSKTIDATAPTITSSNAINQAENAAFSHTLTANESVTWTKTGGADTALFTLAGSNLSMTAKDYESPADADTNNTYVVQVTATDAAGNATDQTITVTVTDVAEGGSVSIENGNVYNSGTNAQDYTTQFPTCAIGTANADRHVVVFVMGSAAAGNPTLSSCDINGSAATEIGKLTTTDICLGMYIAAVAAGTTTAIVPHFTATVGRCAVITYAIHGADITPASVVNTPADNVSAANISASITVPASGVVLSGAAYMKNETCAWTNTTTDDFDVQVEATASLSASTNTTPGAVVPTCTWTTAARRGIISAAFEP